ncbi:hypothetical protein [Hydrogenophaga sp. NH-16]|uniref:hypothetical protein n=1 Tax=Hydrogenophaga sp. NH-16 TaxID=2184519 RepID=UPI000FD920E3|nr:hypothetical protein [Hydrogenophaga sp. NH-16]
MRSASSFAPSDSFNRSFGLLVMAVCVAGAVIAQTRHAVIGWSVAAVVGALCMGALALCVDSFPKLGHFGTCSR